MGKLNFGETVGALFEGADHVFSSKTVVGEPQIIGDTTIVPLVDVSFGMGAGTLGKENKDRAGGGIGGKMTPSAVLVIKDGYTRIVNVRDMDTVNKVLDLVPEAYNKVTSLIKTHGKGNAVEEKVIDDALSAATEYADLS